jgi:hypothetical protein
VNVSTRVEEDLTMAKREHDRGSARRGPGRPKGSGAGREYTDRINVPVTEAQAMRYLAAARELGVPLAEWVREACDAAHRAQEGKQP